MLTSIVSAASSSAWLAKLALASWTACLLLRSADRRTLALPYAIGTCLICLAACVFSVWRIADLTARGLWCGMVLVNLVYLDLLVRDWLAFHPRTAFEEAGGEGAKSAGASKRNGRKTGARKYPEWTMRLEIGLAWMGILLAASAVTMTCMQDIVVPRRVWVISAGHLLAAASMWGVAWNCGLQTTFISTPDRLAPEQGPRVGWPWIARLAMALFIVELLSCTAIFLGPKQTLPAEFSDRVLPAIFALALMILNFVAWMIPHRIRQFQRAGRATEWVTLALAAWLAFLSFAIVCALPVDWPWRSS